MTQIYNRSKPPLRQGRVPTVARWLTTLALAAFSSILMAATVYKWVDEEGTVHFGERPPPGVEATPVNMPAPAAPGATPAVSGSAPKAAADDSSPVSYAEQRRQERRARAQEQQQEQQRIAAACEAQRGLIAQLEPRPKVLVQGDDGEVRMMDDEERLRQLEEAHAFVRKNCE